jgi:hypothetical protein
MHDHGAFADFGAAHPGTKPEEGEVPDDRIFDHRLMGDGDHVPEVEIALGSEDIGIVLAIVFVADADKHAVLRVDDGIAGNEAALADLDVSVDFHQRADEGSVEDWFPLHLDDGHPPLGACAGRRARGRHLAEHRLTSRRGDKAKRGEACPAPDQVAPRDNPAPHSVVATSVSHVMSPFHASFPDDRRALRRS